MVPNQLEPADHLADGEEADDFGGDDAGLGQLRAGDVPDALQGGARVEGHGGGGGGWKAAEGVGEGGEGGFEGFDAAVGVLVEGSGRDVSDMG